MTTPPVKPSIFGAPSPPPSVIAAASPMAGGPVVHRALAQRLGHLPRPQRSKSFRCAPTLDELTHAMSRVFDQQGQAVVKTSHRQTLGPMHS
eukprot:3161898-Amphidinium_carterae.1